MNPLRFNKDAVFEAVAQATARSQCSQHSVTIVAVTKTVDSSLVRDLVNLGVTHIGENRVDKFLEKYHALLGENLTWHLIGTLQRRKVKDVINLVDYFHALDSLSLAREIQKRAEHPINCFLQVNVSGEASKHGFAVEELDSVVEELIELDKINLVGLMTMAPAQSSQEEQRTYFSTLEEIRKQLQARNLPHMPLTELSMGMSGDFETAIECGSTFVRIGTAFFK